MITTNIRLSEKDYQKYRIIALKLKKSFAQLARESLERANWRFEETAGKERSKKAAEAILNESGFDPGDISIREAIEKGRKY